MSNVLNPTSLPVTSTRSVWFTGRGLTSFAAMNASTFVCNVAASNGSVVATISRRPAIQSAPGDLRTCFSTALAS